MYSFSESRASQERLTLGCAKMPPMRAHHPQKLLWGRLGGKLAALAGCAFFLWLACRWLDLPDRPQGGLLAMVCAPQGWRRFLWLWAPLGLAAGSAAWTVLNMWALPNLEDGAAQNPTPHRLWDWLPLSALPLLGICAFLDGPSNQWPLAAGGVYLAGLSFQLVLCCRLLWGHGQEPAPPRLLQGGTCLAFFAFFAGLAFWTCLAVSTAGDETRYILEAERLLQSLGLSEKHIPRQEYYWGRWSDALAWGLANSPLMKWLLLPGVGLGGRLGALLTLSLAAALSLGLLASAARQMGFSARAALLGVWALGGSAPLVQAGQHIYPSALGVLGVSWGLWLLSRRTPDWRRNLLGVVLGGAAISLVKYRLATVGLGLMASALAQWLLNTGWGRLVKWAARLLAAALAALLALILLEALSGGDWGVWRSISLYRWNRAPEWDLMLASLPAMFLDQQFGLLPLAPWLGMGFIGVFFLRRWSREALGHTLWLCVCLLLPLIFYRWLQWDGGFTPPGRFLAPLLPVLALWALPILERPAGKTWRALCGGLLGLTWLISLALALFPQWRYHRMTGVNNLLAWLGDIIQAPLYRFFPAFSESFPPDMLVSLPWLGLLALAGFWFWRRGRAKIVSGGTAALLDGRDWLKGLACLALGLALLAGSARMMPSSALEAESFQRQGSTVLHGDYYIQDKLLLLNRPGARSWTRLVWPGGQREVVLEGYAVSGGKPAPQAPPVVVKISLQGGGEAQLALRPLTDWPEPHAFRLSGPAGYRRITITYVSGRHQLALDRLLIR